MTRRSLFRALAVTAAAAVGLSRTATVDRESPVCACSAPHLWERRAARG